MMKANDIANAKPEVPASERATKPVVPDGSIWYRFEISATFDELRDGVRDLLSREGFANDVVEALATRAAEEIDAERKLGWLMTDEQRVAERGDEWAV